MTSPPHPRPGPSLDRRGFLRGTLGAAVGGLALTGCASPVTAGLTTSRIAKQTVQYWNLFGGGDGVRMQDMEAGFRTNHPDLKLQAVTLTWGNPYYTKLALATLGDKPPDVAVSHLTRMKTLVSSDLLEELKPADMARHGMSAGKFNQRAWNQGLVDGKAYAIPLDTHPFVLFYNTKVCKKAGLLDADGKLKPLDSPEALVDAMARAKKVTGAYGGVLSTVNDYATPWRFFQSLYSQLGGQVLANDGTRVVLDDAKAATVLGLLRSMSVEKGLLPGSIDYPGGVALFASGKSGFYMEGEWEIATFQDAKMPFSMTSFPQLYGTQKAVQADSHTLVIPKSPTDDPARLDRAYTYIKSMLDQSYTWAQGGHIPAWLPFKDSTRYRNMTPQSNYADSADYAVYDQPAWYSGSGSNFEIVMGNAIGAVVSGQLSPQQAIHQIHAKLSRLADTPPPA